MNDLLLAGHEDVVSWGWNGEQLLTRLIELDNKHIDGMDETDEGSVPQWSPVFMQHPHTWALLIDEPLLPSVEAVVGYWSFCSLQPEPYARALAGRLHDSEITPDALRPIDEPGEYDAYVVMFVIAHAHRRSGSIRLVRSFFENLLALARAGIFLRHLCANVFTPEGGRLAAIIGLEPQAVHSKRGRIHARTILSSGEKVFPAGLLELNRLYRTRCAEIPLAELCS